MWHRFTFRQFISGFLQVVAGMLVGILVSIDFHSNLAAGEAIGGIVAAGFVALQTFTAHRS